MTSSIAIREHPSCKAFTAPTRCLRISLCVCSFGYLMVIVRFVGLVVDFLFVYLPFLIAFGRSQRTFWKFTNRKRKPHLGKHDWSLGQHVGTWSRHPPLSACWVLPVIIFYPSVQCVSWRKAKMATREKVRLAPDDERDKTITMCLAMHICILSCQPCKMNILGWPKFMSIRCKGARILFYWRLVFAEVTRAGHSRAIQPVRATERAKRQ